MLPSVALAHPLGNESVVHINILWILPDRVEFDLFLDFAEGPSRRYPEEIDANNDGEETTEEQKAWLMGKAKDCIPLLTATIDGRPVPLVVADQARNPNNGKEMPIPGMVKVSGFAGAPTYRTLVRYIGRYPAALPPGEHVLDYEDATFGQYNGLKRIILEKVPAVEIADSSPKLDFLDPEGKAFLYDQYDPANLPQEKKATIKFVLKSEIVLKSQISDLKSISATEQRTTATGTTQPSLPSEAGAAQLSPPSQEGARGGTEHPTASRPVTTGQQDLPYPILDPRNDPAKTSQSSRQAQRLVGLLQGRWGFMVFLTITALSFIWGAAHALMPGHAKTVVAAYLISRSGNYWHAVVLAVIVTITHTALVVAVGLIIWFYQASNPTLGARLQLWLGIIAGLLVAGMGLTLIWRALTGRMAHHHHDHHHDHDHEPRSWLRKLFTHSHPHMPEFEGESGRGGEGATEGQRDRGTEGQAGTSPERKRGVGPEGAGVNSRGREPPVQDLRLGGSSPERAADGAGKGHAHHHEHAHSHAHDHHHEHDHSHDHAHHHAHPHPHHHPHSHDHGPAAVQSEIRNPKSEIASELLTFRMLLLLGITGGIVPCPTATIILLLGIGANVVAGALYAVGIFSLGLALTLMLIGFLALSSRRIAASILSDARHQGELSTTGRRILLQAIPAISGALVVALGLAITANYLYHLYNGRALFEWLG